MGVEEGKGLCKVIIESDLGAFSFGSEGFEGEFNFLKEVDDQIIFRFHFLPFPLIGLGLKFNDPVEFN